VEATSVAPAQVVDPDVVRDQPRDALAEKPP